jgi:toxin YoeB
VNWTLAFTAHAKKDAKKLASSGLKSQAQRLLNILVANPYQTPPRYEKLIGDLTGRTPDESIFNIVWSIKC